MRVQSLSGVDPQEKRMATHSSILTCKIHGHGSSWGRKESDTSERTHTQGGQEDHRSTEPGQCQLFPVITPLGSRADRT